MGNPTATEKAMIVHIDECSPHLQHDKSERLIKSGEWRMSWLKE